MRHDMFKVIVERPRHGSYFNKRKYKLNKKDFDSFRQKEGMKFIHRGETKEFNENLKPLKRFLISRIGQPWNKVFSEICKTLDNRNAYQETQTRPRPFIGRNG